jgi:hypothetical protein
METLKTATVLLSLPFSRGDRLIQNSRAAHDSGRQLRRSDTFVVVGTVIFVNQQSAGAQHNSQQDK